jgi:hypothetical protein
LIAYDKLRRLMQMDSPEIQHRLLQAMHIVRERLALTRKGSGKDSSDWRSSWNIPAVGDPYLRAALQADAATAEALLPDYLFSRGRPVFCATANHEEIARIYPELFGARVDAIAREANRLCDHFMKVFAYPEFACGPRIPWRKDAAHEIESGLDHWSRIQYLDFASVGDSKIVWEPNRHQHLVILATAYRLTGENRYAEEAFAQFEDWRRANAYLRGINWASSLELAFRTWSWIWMIHLLAGSPAATGKRLGEMTQALALHADFISTYLSTYFSPNTHLLGEGFALFAIGLLFPELRSSSSYRGTGRTILVQEMARQVRADGSHSEQSTCYHRYATDFFLCAAILADRNDCPFPDDYRARLEKMAEFMVYTAWPDGTHPMTGDADGGRLLPFGVHDPLDHRSTLSTAAVYFGRKDFRDRAGRLYEESLWLLGPDAAARFDELKPESAGEPSKAFDGSGAIVMRSDWSEAANMLAFDAGPQGMGGASHGHADALSVVCSGQGTKWLIDPGTYTYTSSPEWRDFFRSTRAHNTLVVDGQEQSETGDVFKWRSLCSSRLERWATFPNLDYASASHDGYQLLAAPLRHRRLVVFVKPHYWFLLDDLDGAGTHSLEFLFHFAPDICLDIDDNRCRAKSGDKRFLVAAGPRVSLEVIEGCGQPIQGWYSHNYGHREPSPVLVGKISCATPARFPWLLWPGPPEGLRFRPFSDERRVWTVETSEYADFFVSGDQPSKHTHGDLATDADFAFFRQDRNGEITRLTLLDGSWVTRQAEFLYRGSGKVEEIDIDREAEVIRVRMNPVKPFTIAAANVRSVVLNGRQAGFKNTRQGIEVREGN